MRDSQFQRLAIAGSHFSSSTQVRRLKGLAGKELRLQLFYSGKYTKETD